MSFFGNLVHAVAGAIASVANAVVNALSPVVESGGIVGEIAGEVSDAAESVLGASTEVAEVSEDGEIDDEEAEELIEDTFKLLVGASILDIKNEMSKVYNDVSSVFNDTLTNFNNEITVLNKSAVLITSAEAAKFSTYGERFANLWSDFFMPTDLPGELNAAQKLDNPLLKGVGKVGGKLGLVGTVLNPIMEYDNSLEPYKEDIDAAYEIDPKNANIYINAMRTEALADAASFGYGRGVLNTIPSLVQLTKKEKPEWTEKWINNVNYWVNSRNLINEADKAFKDPVKGQKIKQFLR